MQPLIPFARWCFVLSLLAGTGGRISAAEPAAASTPAARNPTTAVDRATVERWFGAWKAPVAPRRLIGNIHYVGASGVSSFLITTENGHIILDTGFDDTVPTIVRGVEQLGFRVADVKIILSSHAHVDHVGGHAALKALTGARVIASAEDARLLESGGAADFTPLPREVMAFAPVTVDEVIEDGGKVTLGSVTLTAQLTPGHTRGATTWTMPLEVDGRELAVVFFSSASINPGTILVGNPDYPGIVDDYEQTFTRLKALPCDIFLAPHGGQFAMAEKFARLDRGEAPNPFIDPAGWKSTLAESEKVFRAQLAAETADKE